MIVVPAMTGSPGNCQNLDMMHAFVVTAVNTISGATCIAGETSRFKIGVVQELRELTK